MSEARKWYAANMGNDHQGLVIDETGGRNVAVAYDKTDAPLLAAAPTMDETLAESETVLLELAQYVGAEHEAMAREMAQRIVNVRARSKGES